MSGKSIYTIALASLLGALGPAAMSGEGARKQCLTVVSQPTHAKITLKGSRGVAGRTPSTFCMLEPGSAYFLKMEKRGYETRVAGLKLDEKGKAVLHGRALLAIGKSMAVPGLGQWSAGRKGPGMEAFLTVMGTSAMAWLAYDAFRDERDEYRFYFSKAQTAVTMDEKNVYLREARRSASETNRARDRAIMTAGIAGWAYVMNVADALLLNLAPGVRYKEGGTVVLSSPQKSMPRALLRSALSPGMGQSYMGHGFRGLFFQTAFYGAALFAARSWWKYGIKRDRYDMKVSELAAASSLDEVTRIRNEMNVSWDDLREAEKSRNAALVTLGSIWLLNMLDVATSSTGLEPGKLNLSAGWKGEDYVAGIVCSF
jgi:hypothetical protein